MNKDKLGVRLLLEDTATVLVLLHVLPHVGKLLHVVACSDVSCGSCTGIHGSHFTLLDLLFERLEKSVSRRTTLSL